LQFLLVHRRQCPLGSAKKSGEISIGFGRQGHIHGVAQGFGSAAHPAAGSFWIRKRRSSSQSSTHSGTASERKEKATTPPVRELNDTPLGAKGPKSVSNEEEFISQGVMKKSENPAIPP